MSALMSTENSTSAIERAAAQLGVTSSAFGDHGAPNDEATSALATLYRECAPIALRAARRYAASEEDAQDVVHDVFLDLHAHIQSYRPTNFLGWLTRLATRAAIRSRRSVRCSRLFDDSVAMVADEACERDETALRVRGAVAGLPVRLRAVVQLRVYEECTHAEIGRRLGISAAASEVRFCRAVKRLRMTLDVREARTKRPPCPCPRDP